MISPSVPARPPSVARALTGVPALVVIVSMLGFGGFARDHGWSLGETLLASAVIWALPAQVILIGALSSGASVAAALAAVSISSIRLLPMVCTVLPMLRDGKPRLLLELAASHFVAQTVWIISLLHLPDLPRARRTRFYFSVAILLVLICLVACAIGWWLARTLPLPLALALYFLTPLSFLLLTTIASKRFADRVALALGFLLLPVVHETAPLIGLGDWDLPMTGIIAGAIAFAVDLRRGGRA